MMETRDADKPGKLEICWVSLGEVFYPNRRKHGGRGECIADSQHWLRFA